MTIRIGTRGSRLALKQAQLVEQALRRQEKDLEIRLVIMQTKGDRVLDRPLSEIGDKGLFVSEFEQALLEEKIDLAVHSAKDLPGRLAAGLTIAAVLPRGDVRDVLLLPKGAKGPGEGRPFCLGTGSQRRILQAGLLWEGVSCQLVRGNVETRIRKLKEGQYDGLLLAKAGLDRLEIGPETEPGLDFCPLEPERFLPAACQGIIPTFAGVSHRKKRRCVLKRSAAYSKSWKRTAARRPRHGAAGRETGCFWTPATECRRAALAGNFAQPRVWAANWRKRPRGF